MRIVIEAGKSDREYLKDLWRYRELFYVLAWRDVSVRYKQTAIGVAWAVIRPALTTVVFTVIFGKLGKFPSGGVPYPILVMAGMLPWQLFSAALSESGGVAIVLLDIDRFKDVNDTLGHPIGDGLLKAVAQRLLANTRDVDVVLTESLRIRSPFVPQHVATAEHDECRWQPHQRRSAQGGGVRVVRPRTALVKVRDDEQE